MFDTAGFASHRRHENFGAGWPLGHAIRWPGPPPIHHACRCGGVPRLRSWVDLVKDRDLSQRLRQALERVPASARTSMDGAVSSTLHFEAWLKTKTEAFQLEKPGRGRWELWHRGKISFLDLIDQRGNPLSVAELEALVARL